LNLPVTAADKDYAKTFGIKIKAGSFFQHNTAGIVLNETALRLLGLTSENAIGKQIQTPVAGSPVTITGVVKDFHYSSMQDQIGPIGFVHVNTQNIYRFLVLKLNTSHISQTMNAVAAKWKSLSPNAPFDYTFMDDKFATLYKSELQLQKAASIATWLTMIIVFMGIFGVIAFTLVKRTKEIAMRKVLGADARNIISLFIREYALLILIANIIAWPLAYRITDQWLENYVYRVEQNWGTFLFVGGIIFLAASLLVTVQCYKVALANPVKSLRTE
jgi:ABC-type antimicrobial peptide transport system permease subunit